MSDAAGRAVPTRSRRGVGLLVAAAAVVAAGALALATALNPRTAALWTVPTAVVVGWEWRFLRHNAGANHPPGEPGAVATGLGVANAVTLVRGVLYAAVAGFLLTGGLPGAWAWTPALLYGAGASLDAVDGALARGPGRPTALGGKLDLAFDTLGFLVAPLVGVAWGLLPVWYLSLSAARYLFNLGRWRRRVRGLPVYDLPDSRVRRPLAGLQMAFIAVALAPVLPTAVVRALAAVVLVPSLSVFVRDYLVVAGHLRTRSSEPSPGEAGRPTAGDAAATADRADPTDGD